MFAKFIVSGEDREEAVQRGLRVLEGTTIEGVPTTIPFHQQVLTDDRFLNAEHTTKFVDEHLDIAGSE